MTTARKSAWYEVRCEGSSMIVPVCLDCATKATDPDFKVTYREMDTDGLILYCDVCGETISS